MGAGIRPCASAGRFSISADDCSAATMSALRRSVRGVPAYGASRTGHVPARAHLPAREESSMPGADPTPTASRVPSLALRPSTKPIEPVPASARSYKIRRNRKCWYERREHWANILPTLVGSAALSAPSSTPYSRTTRAAGRMCSERMVRLHRRKQAGWYAVVVLASLFGPAGVFNALWRVRRGDPWRLVSAATSVLFWYPIGVRAWRRAKACSKDPVGYE